MINIEQAKDLILFCKTNGVKHIHFQGLVCELFEEKPTPMSLDPKDLVKTLAEPMPPDSQMLFASAEDIEEKAIE